jgi:putative membrane protein
MNFISKLLLTALVVVVLSNVLPGIYVESYSTAIWVAFVIALLNMFVRPLLILFTLPATIISLGLFLFVINAIIILLAGNLVSGFVISGFLSAMLFSILLTVFRSVLLKILKDDKTKK